jgi:hypothetical protein
MTEDEQDFIDWAATVVACGYPTSYTFEPLNTMYIYALMHKMKRRNPQCANLSVDNINLICSFALSFTVTDEFANRDNLFCRGAVTGFTLSSVIQYFKIKCVQFDVRIGFPMRTSNNGLKFVVSSGHLNEADSHYNDLSDIISCLERCYQGECMPHCTVYNVVVTAEGVNATVRLTDDHAAVVLLNDVYRNGQPFSAGVVGSNVRCYKLTCMFDFNHHVARDFLRGDFFFTAAMNGFPGWNIQPWVITSYSFRKVSFT